MELGTSRFSNSNKAHFAVTEPTGFAVIRHSHIYKYINTHMYINTNPDTQKLHRPEVWLQIDSTAVFSVINNLTILQTS